MTRPSRPSAAALQAIGERDTQLQLLSAACSALPAIYKAHKWFLTREDLDYTALWILLRGRRRWRRSRCSSARLLADREVLPQAMKLNPAFFKIVYTDLLNTKKTRRVGAGGAGRRGRRTWPSARRRCSRPVLEHLREVGRGAVGHGDRRPLQAELRHRRSDRGMRVPGGSGADRESAAAGPADEEEQRRRAGAGVLLRDEGGRCPAKTQISRSRRGRPSRCRARGSTI